MAISRVNVTLVSTVTQAVFSIIAGRASSFDDSKRLQNSCTDMSINLSAKNYRCCSCVQYTDHYTIRTVE